MKGVRRPTASPTPRPSGASRLRTMGIVAHVDAGKTTTCERILFHGGVIRHMGDVDRGNTVMDFMRVERERGITVKAAAICVPWKDHVLNLIDTPGHVDFTVEVERATRVLDGAVCVLDAVAGVQAQTETVWRQTLRHDVSRMVFINKVDREGATLERSLESLAGRFSVRPLLTQLPLGLGPEFAGHIDLVELKAVRPSEDGRTLLEEAVENVGAVRKARDDLAAALCDLDEAFLTAALSETPLVPADFHAALRRITVERRNGIVCLLGSSLKNKGVPTLMDAIVKYLPSPVDRPPAPAVRLKDGSPVSVALDGDRSAPFVALAFKVIHDPNRGLITYFRVYSGFIRAGQAVQNTTRNVRERIAKLVELRGEDTIEVTEVGAGGIGAALGLKHAATGDTLITPEHPSPLRLSGVRIPPPVFVSAIEPVSSADAKPVEEALQLLQREDPSFEVVQDAETGQTLLKGMGELHLDILRERLASHYKVNAVLGRARVSYRSTLAKAAQGEFTYSRTVGPRRAPVTLRYRIVPAARGAGVTVALPTEEVLAGEERRAALREGFKSAAERGVSHGLPLTDIAVEVLGCEGGEDDTAMLTAAAGRVLSNVVREHGMAVLEPIMKVELSVLTEHIGTLVADLTGKRRATIRNIDAGIADVQIVHAEVPLKELVSYSTTLRSMTRGTASFSMEFLRFGDMAGTEQQTVLRELIGM